MGKQYRTVALGGTFDHFHLGHQQFLDFAAHLADELIIGVTDPILNQSKILSQIIEPLEIRTNIVSNYLSASQSQVLFSTIPLKDPFGPTLNDNSIQAIVVTSHTKPGADRINQERKHLKLPPLELSFAPLINDNVGQYLSSSRIRQGLVNRHGHVYRLDFTSRLTLTSAQKNHISQVQGQLINPKDLTVAKLARYTRIALLGDQVTERFIKHHLPFHFSIIDHKINRLAHQTDLGSYQPSFTLKTLNPPGVIEPHAADALATLIGHGSGLLIVSGEEDLLGFPLVAHLPLQSLIVYGQPNLGMVGIEVTEPEKERLLQLIR